jgi:hypothetical protein
MDIIENGDVAPRSYRRTAVWVVAAVVALGGLYGLRRMTESRQPSQSTPPVTAPQSAAPVPITDDVQVVGDQADVTSELMAKAMSALPPDPDATKGAMVLVGNNFANGQEATGLEDDTMGRKGTYEVTVLCLGTGGTHVTVMDPEAADQGSPETMRLVCTGRPATTTVKMSTARLHIMLNPDPETVAAFAYAITPAKR